MKATVFKRPKTKKAWFSLGLILFVLSLGNWPVIQFINKDILVFGFPLMMFWTIVIIFATSFAMFIINKIGGVD